MADDPTRNADKAPAVPDLRPDESFKEISHKLAYYIIEAVDSPLGWDDLRSSEHIKRLQPLIEKLSSDVHHPAVVNALLALKAHFAAIESAEDCGINQSRGLACELVAWQFVLTLSSSDALEYLVFELHRPGDRPHTVLNDETDAASNVPENGNGDVTERTALLSRQESSNSSNIRGSLQVSATDTLSSDPATTSFARGFMHLNALEIAAVSGAKHFLSQRCVQDIVDGIWRGDIIFWDALTPNAVKRPRFYSNSGGDPWCRLRVPLYMKTFEIGFLLSLLGLFYIVSLQHVIDRVTSWEIAYYIFIAGYAAQEWEEFVDSGAKLYSMDIWSVWDIGIILVGTLFFVLRMTSLLSGYHDLHKIAFGVLALHSLFLTPRIFSLLSLSPYYGVLLPTLREMGKQFVRFLGFVLIIYVGFFSTFMLLARESGKVQLNSVSITILKVFFGAGVVGFDIAPQISPYLGLPVMVVFVCLTNQLLITSMMAHITTSLAQVQRSAREEYLYVYSVYVLEASTSNKLTYFYTPLNVVQFVIAPVLYFLPRCSALNVRIMLLKATHAPIVGLIRAYERWKDFRAKLTAAKRKSMTFGPIEQLRLSRAPTIVSRINESRETQDKSRKRRSLITAGESFAEVPASLVQASRQGVTKLQKNADREHLFNEYTSKARVMTAPLPQDHENVNVVEMMQLLRHLSTQVEELRAYIENQGQAPGTH